MLKPKTRKKILVVFYSRTGNTKKVANEIAAILNADICEIKGCKYEGVSGYIKAGYQAIKNKKPCITIDKNPEDYDLIIIGTPNWGSTLASPVRAFIDGKEFENVAYYCLQGGRGGEKILEELENLCGKSIARMIINDRELKNDVHKTKINEFCEKIKQTQINKK